MLVGVTLAGDDPEETDASLDELALLVDTAGAGALDRVVQRRSSPDAATYVGSGKAKEIKAAANAIDADTVVFDDELTPAQQYNLEKILGRSALDRTAVILDIFAQNASSQEGKAQVELAQLPTASRAFAQADAPSPSRAAVSVPGAGETQLEVDRRRLVRRVHKLEADLRKVQAHRETQSKQRSRTRNRAIASSGTPTPASRRCSSLAGADVRRGSTLRHARCHHATPRPSRR